MSRTTLSLLGTISFDVPQDGRSGLYQSKKIAALAYLLLARGAVRRSELATLLWPESDERRARRSLNQLVLELRRDHGAEAIIARGEEDLLVDRSVLTSDASLLFDAAAVGDVREVVRLYRGELMPGFIADGASSYNDWLDRQREAVKGIVADSLWKMADASDPRTAISLLEQCIALRPSMKLCCDVS